MDFNSELFTSKNGFELLVKLFENSGEGIMLFDADGAIQLMNPRSESMFGYKESELKGKKVEILIPSKLRDKHKGHRADYMSKPVARSMGSGIDLEGQKKDGSNFPLEISLNYIQHENQTWVVTFLTDISVRKENESKLEEYANQLEEKVKQRTSELEHLNLGLQSQIQERKIAEQELQQSLAELKKAQNQILESLEREKELNEMKSKFISLASHEFRTPLTTILSSANIIEKYSEEKQQEKRKKHVDRISKNVQNMTSILKDFLSLEKLEGGDLSFEKKDINLCRLLPELAEELGPGLREGQQIEIKCDQKDLIVNSDENVLRSILTNLISNASKYSEINKKIKLNASALDSGTRISIIDQGIGIPEKDKKNLFTRFHRAINAGNIQGTGLGLYLVRKYTNLIGADIEFVSKVGKGSKFSLIIK